MLILDWNVILSSYVILSSKKSIYHVEMEVQCLVNCKCQVMLKGVIICYRHWFYFFRCLLIWKWFHLGYRLENDLWSILRSYEVDNCFITDIRRLPNLFIAGGIKPLRIFYHLQNRFGSHFISKNRVKRYYVPSLYL